MNRSFDINFYKGKRVFITGHTGFKGSWMCLLLLMMGAKITGFSLKPEDGNIMGSMSVDKNKSLFCLCGLDKLKEKDGLTSIYGDIRDYDALYAAFDKADPEIVIHMAAQPIVRESYSNPRLTYETNVIGTVNILECVRKNPGVRSFVNVTTDKVYLNKEWDWGYRENEELMGFDPYSNSKSCSELVTYSYRNSFFTNSDSQRPQTAITTMRAGNVIGGGDFGEDRIIPDCVRCALSNKSTITVRNPYSIRPYQFVLEPVYAYIYTAAMCYEDFALAGSYNIGPDECDCVTTGGLTDLFCQKWNEVSDAETKLGWVYQKEGKSNNEPHEAKFLRLDCSKFKNTFGWKPCWHIDTTISKIIEWTKVYQEDGDIRECMERQIKEFLCDESKEK